MVPLPPDEWYNFYRVARIPLGGVYARPGEYIVCESPIKQHIICEVAKTVRKGDVPDYEYELIDWQQERPTIGSSSVQLCEKCRARWAHDVFFHFPEGWRI